MKSAIIIILACTVLGFGTYHAQIIAEQISQPSPNDIRREGFEAGLAACRDDLVNEITLDVVRRHGAGIYNSVVQEGE